MYKYKVLFYMFLGLSLMQAPAFAQKKGIVKAAKKAAVQSTNNIAAPLLQTAGPAAWRQAALKEAKEIDKLFASVILKNRSAQTKELADLASFYTYNEHFGLLSAIESLWSDLLISLHVTYFGPNTLETLSPLTIRKNLLQAEARYHHALKNWQNVKNRILKQASAAEYAHLQEQYAATRFFFVDSPKLDTFGKDLASLGEGYQDVISLISLGQKDIETLYRQMLAFAHGKEPFPLRTSEVYRFLALQEYPMDMLPDLQENLNSIECEMLGEWGWRKRDIRKVIALYNSPNWITPYEGDPSGIVSSLRMQHDLLSNWRNYWNNRRAIDLLRPKTSQTKR